MSDAIKELLANLDLAEKFLRDRGFSGAVESFLNEHKQETIAAEQPIKTLEEIFSAERAAVLEGLRAQHASASAAVGQASQEVFKSLDRLHSRAHEANQIAEQAKALRAEIKAEMTQLWMRTPADSNPLLDELHSCWAYNDVETYVVQENVDVIPDTEECTLLNPQDFPWGINEKTS